MFAVFPTFQRTLGKVGVNVDGVGTTPLSGDFRLDRPLGPGARDILQSGVEHAYDVFLEPRRREPQENARPRSTAWRRAGSGPGATRTSRGLVDSLGTFEDAVKAAAKRADLGEDYELEYLDPQLTWREALAMEFGAAASWVAHKLGVGVAQPALVRRVLDPLQREVARWASFNDPRQLYSYCFCAP